MQIEVCKYMHLAKSQRFFVVHSALMFIKDMSLSFPSRNSVK